jgi:hypothetical protein
MAANHMTLSSQEANLLRVQEALPINLAGGDKKMPVPPIFLEKARDARDSAFPAVVEGQKKRKRLITGICEFVCSARRGVAYLCDGRKMGFELGRLNLYFAVPGPVKPLESQSVLSITS